MAPVVSSSMSPASMGQLFTLSNDLDYLLYGGDDDLPLCLAFGRRAQAIVQRLIDAPVFGYAGVSETAEVIPDHVIPEGISGRCDWIAFVIDGDDPHALSQADAAAQAISNKDIFLRFALVLEGEKPYELKDLLALNEALDGVVLIGKRSADSEPAEATATALLEYFLVPSGLVGTDIGDVRSVLRQGVGIHRAVSAYCTSQTLVATMNQLVSGEPIDQANAAMAWVGADSEFTLSDYDEVVTGLLHLAPDAYFMVSMGYAWEWTSQRTHLVLVWG